MNRLANIKSKEIIEKLIGSPYAFAAWKMPQSSERMLIVSFEEAKQTSLPISELTSGFLINRFSDNHPAKPYHIKADLSFVNDDFQISTSIGGQQIDEFLEVIKKGNSMVKSELDNRIVQGADTESQFEKLVQKAVDEIKAGSFEKVVLARYEEILLPHNFSPFSFFDRICESYPNAFCNMAYIPGEGIWVGATPELLLSNDKYQFKTIALAGTKALQPDQSLSEIAWTQKEIEEQAFVSRYIINCFKKLRLREFDEKGPKTIKAGNLAHLKTEYLVNYKEVSHENLADQMLELLHPTSAVCGMPLDAAKSFIKENEAFDRSFYSGYLGPVHIQEATNLFVNLRCMQIIGDTATLYAGAGITEDSIPSNELLETSLKMSVMKRMI